MGGGLSGFGLRENGETLVKGNELSEDEYVLGNLMHSMVTTVYHIHPVSSILQRRKRRFMWVN